MWRLQRSIQTWTPTLSEATLWQISERPPRPKGKSITRVNAAHGNAPASEQLLLFEQYSTPPWLWHASRLNHIGRVTKSPWIPMSGLYSSGRPLLQVLPAGEHLLPHALLNPKTTRGGQSLITLLSPGSSQKAFLNKSKHPSLET